MIDESTRSPYGSRCLVGMYTPTCLFQFFDCLADIVMMSNQYTFPLLQQQSPQNLPIITRVYFGFGTASGCAWTKKGFLRETSPIARDATLPPPAPLWLRAHASSAEWSFKKGKRNGILSHTYEQFLSAAPFQSRIYTVSF